MSEIDPSLAEKVVATDLRNIVQKVGQGEKLSPGDRQMFIGIVAGGNDEELRKTRVSNLVRKWLFGGRLSREERDEIAHVLPPEQTKVTRESYAEKPEHYETWYGIQRRMFFRWLAHGRSVADGPDLPPFDSPHELPVWYERMKARGIFKQRFPKDILARIEQIGRGKKSGADGDKKTTTPPSENAGNEQPKVPASFSDRNHTNVGIRFEIEEQEQRVAALRRARDEAYLAGNRIEGDALSRQYSTEMESFTVWKARAHKLAEQEEQLVWRSDVEADLNDRIPAIVTSGMFLFDRIAPKLEAATTHGEKRAIWRTAWIEHCRSLSESKFAPPLCLEALTA